MLSPPRLPALQVTFHAFARSNRIQARPGQGYSAITSLPIAMQNHAPYACSGASLG